jgi:hypothetical protein
MGQGAQDLSGQERQWKGSEAWVLRIAENFGTSCNTISFSREIVAHDVVSLVSLLSFLEKKSDLVHH